MKKILKILSGIAVAGLAMGTASLAVFADEEAVTTTAVVDVPITTTVAANFPVYTTTAVIAMPDVTGAEITTIFTTDTEVQTADSTAVTTQTEVIPIQSGSATSLTTIPASQTTTAVVTTKVSVTCPPIDENVVFGWNKINEKWFYFNGNKFVTGVQRIDDDFYLFAKNGALRTGWQTVNKRRCYYDYETHSPVFGWVEYRGDKYYNDPKTGKLTGMQELDGKIYIFSESGALNIGFTVVGNYMYYCNEEGVIQYGGNEKKPILIGDNYYYISPDGYVMRGWQTVNGLRYFYDFETGLPVFDWINYKGNVYYADKATGKYIGTRYIGKYPYRFNEKGILITGMQYFETENATSYIFEDGTRAANQIVSTDNGSFYFDEDGYMKTGWITFGDNEYYFDEDGKMLKGITVIDGNKYIFADDGKMLKGIAKYNNGIYYLDENGIMLTGWQKINSNTYYLNEKTGLAYTGWHEFGNKKCYFDSEGVMATGMYTIDDKTYYFGADGDMHTGWKTINNKKYYFGVEGAAKGIMYTYRHIIDGIDYLFYSTGEMVTTGNQNIVVKALSQLGQEGGMPYCQWWGYDFRFEWCACFVSWCATQCGYTQNNQTPKFISCKVGIEWFQEHGQWKGKNYIPKSGDYIFFDWEPDGIADHIGIVDYYEDGYVYTVEGNSNDMVRKKIYSIDSENIYGFAAPNFLGGKD